MYQRSNMRAKNLKLIQYNIGVNLCDLRLDNGFLKVTPKTQQKVEKMYKLDFIKIINVCAADDSIKKVTTHRM